MENYNLSVDELLIIINGELKGNKDNSFNYFSTDSRNISNTELFIALSGEKFNGHNFIKDVISKGVRGFIVQENIDLDNEELTFIKVDNSLKAYQNIANYIRKKLNPFVIGITGSSGKTSTKEIAYSFFSQFYNTFKSEANYNNEIGVPLSLLNMSKNDKVAIIEMGMRGKGQIQELAEIAEPNAGIITGIGTAHIELLGSVEEIADAKWELAENLLKTNSYLSIPIYDKHLVRLSSNYPKDKLLTIDLEKNENASFYLINSWIENDKQYFSYFDNITKKEHNASLSVYGKHQISNALLVISLSKVLNIELPDFIDLSFENLSGRTETFKIDTSTIVNDSYNANPESMKAAIETFLDLYKNKENILVIGEMRELGDKSLFYHQEIGNFLNNFNFKELLVINKNAEEIYKTYKNKNSIFFEDNKSAGNYLKKYLSEGVNIFFKASRGAKLEEVIEVLREK
ncbi:MAG: UDP-N-acetylmuramoyl-tripeptide--D-alanyl-D-alanine ligase [Candidatus Sericytochromatia bacterium]